MTVSLIEWTGKTWNPLTGCTKISPGCKFCYAERMSRRLRAMGLANYRNGFELTLHPHMLDAPLKWKKPCLVFKVLAAGSPGVSRSAPSTPKSQPW